MPEFSNAMRVMRKENRPIRGATVIAADVQKDDAFHLIAYDEGGEGWWPEGHWSPEAGP
jgi:hypothetical protein